MTYSVVVAFCTGVVDVTLTMKTGEVTFSTRAAVVVSTRDMVELSVTGGSVVLSVLPEVEPSDVILTVDMVVLTVLDSFPVTTLPVTGKTGAAVWVTFSVVEDVVLCSVTRPVTFAVATTTVLLSASTVEV